jgi:hypothetical protein
MTPLENSGVLSSPRENNLIGGNLDALIKGTIKLGRRNIEIAMKKAILRSVSKSPESACIMGKGPSI